MEDVKAWWTSRIIWTQIVGILFMVASKFVELPEGITEEAVVTAILTVMGIVSIFFRTKTTAVIGKPDNSVG